MLEHRRHTGLLVIALASGLSLLSLEAHAQATMGRTARNAKPILDTAYTLEAHEAQIGLGLQAFGIAKRLTIFTVLAGWILPAFSDAFAPNFWLRFRFMDARRWSFSADAGMAYVRVKDSNLIGSTNQNANSVVFPFELRVTNRAPLGLLSSIEATYVAGSATLQDGAVIDDFDSGVVSSSLQFAAALEYPVARGFALTLKGRVVAWVPKGQIDVVAIVDESNEIRVRGTITQDDVAGSYNVIGGFAFYSRLFDFRVGAGYGRFIFPRVGFVYLETGLVVDAAAYFRF